MSFNGAITQAATGALREAGHDVIVSDLYAMGFNPVSGRQNFTTVNNPDDYRQQGEEAHAAAQDGLAPELQQEMDKLFWVRRPDEHQDAARSAMVNTTASNQCRTPTADDTG